MVVTTSLPLRRWSDRLACDRIQIPPDGPFSSPHLTWYNESAWILEHRFMDFLEGEEHRPLCNTSFKNTQTEPYMDKKTGCLLRTKKRYHCSYGPLDARDNVENDLPDKRKFDNGKSAFWHTTLTGNSVRRGCTCHFYVIRSEDRPSAVQITWVEREHDDKLGKPCHGLRDKTAEFNNAHVAPRLSRRTWEFVERLVRTGVSSTEIVKAHFRNLRHHWRKFIHTDQDQSSRWSRDMMLTPRDVKCIRASVQRKKVDFNTADHMAVDTWAVKNKDQVFLYQPKRDEDTPFLLGWASEWQIVKAAVLGHGHTIAMDATFGTNIFDIPLFTVLAYDPHQNGLPIAWGLLEKAKAEHLALFMEKLKLRIEAVREQMMLDPAWRPSCFMIDVAGEEILCLSWVFQGIPIILCLWHVRRAWTKQLIKKVKNLFNRADMNKDLKHLMYNAGDDHAADSLAFMAKWKSEEMSFTDYFETYWLTRMERWMVKFRTFDHNNQNTNGAVERWHCTLKMHLRSEKATKSGRSMIWLIGMLSDDLEQFYWCMLSLKWQGAICNKVKEGYVFASIHKARLIEDSQVTYLNAGPDGGRRARVVTYKDDGTEKHHLLQNWNKDDCTCTCGHSEQGNTCKHQIKILLMDGYTEMKLLNLLGTKWGSCCGGLEYEYELFAGEDVDGEIEVDVPCPEEANITFPLKTFKTLEEEVPEEKLDIAYHTYGQQYFVGLVEKGFAKLEKLGSQTKNLAAVRLREWYEWICNEEALADPPEFDQFPLSTQFVRPVGSDNSLKRRKDLVELIWDKQQKGTRGKSKEEIAAAKEKRDLVMTPEFMSASGWKQVQLKPGMEDSVIPYSCDSELSQKEGSPFGEFLETESEVIAPKTQAWSELNPTASLQVQSSDPVRLPFVQKKKRRESDQEMLDRQARESLDLNNFPMDYEVPDLPENDTGNTKPAVKKGQLKRKGEGSTEPTQTSSVPNSRPVPKRRGRPVGSKNKPKQVGRVGGSRPPLGALKSNVPSITDATTVGKGKGQQNSSLTPKENSAAWANSTFLLLRGRKRSLIPERQERMLDGGEAQWTQGSQIDEELVVRLSE